MHKENDIFAYQCLSTLGMGLMTAFEHLSCQCMQMHACVLGSSQRSGAQKNEISIPYTSEKCYKLSTMRNLICQFGTSRSASRTADDWLQLPWRLCALASLVDNVGFQTTLPSKTSLTNITFMLQTVARFVALQTVLFIISHQTLIAFISCFSVKHEAGEQKPTHACQTLAELCKSHPVPGCAFLKKHL